mmetsp:Transcript_24126/g.58280  ORF Transcript_24126/g.58280 Transcript_24126/m.58280 type:complete len:564 (-) Transcript_24126:148-1839(-)|eukprot:CAMPEP_0181120722 /NCGR_PEP_ID=MMETSP1071-20121207/24320_1 /TAXON_ID=35127 /ORGANISM="Thalassiosira sp., Strain NH16" /LENGTH=563 /DNA_ID=CAMNT_0023205421 /DNA_START=102 /DNA_END=1793 /DNA_ORIENTATION=+
MKCPVFNSAQFICIILAGRQTNAQSAFFPRDLEATDMSMLKDLSDSPLSLSMSYLGVSGAKGSKAQKGTTKSKTGKSRKVTLNAKIEHAHDRYAAGRSAIIQRVAVEHGTMERAEWENLLNATDTELFLTIDDLAALSARQASEIAHAASKAKKQSAIKVDDFRSKISKVESFCAALPREAILHVHPGGTRNLATVQELLTELNPIVNGTEILEEANNGVDTMLYPSEVTALEALPVQSYSEFDDTDKKVVEELFFMPTEPCCHDFKRFEALFDIAGVLLYQDPTKLQYVGDKTHLDFSKRAKELGLSYVEFTATGIPPSREKLEAKFEYFKRLIESETDMTAHWVYAYVRTIYPATINKGWAQTKIELIEENPGEAIKGIDLLANEAAAPALETGQQIYVPILKAVQDGRIQLNRTMHSGELGDIRNVRDAMIMGAQRIGHGVLLKEDPVAIEYARKMNVGTVVSLVSNKLLKVVPSYSSHPFLNYLRLGIPVSQSTDDEGMFRTDIVNECVIAVTNTDIQYSELIQMSRNAVSQSFADDALKATLMANLESEIAAFEASWV